MHIFVKFQISISAVLFCLNWSTFGLDIEKHPNCHLLPNNCGKSGFVNRIIGGDEVELGQFPWLARIGYKLPSCSKKILYRCGAVLINDMYILTAAHCVVGLPNTRCPINGRNVPFVFATIAIGEYDARTNPDCIDDVCADPVQVVTPQKIIVHPNYDNPRYSNDICLTRLSQRINLSQWVSPICLPRNEHLNNFYSDAKAFVAGWGTTSVQTPTSSNIPMFVHLPVIDTESCGRSFSKFLNLSKIHQICAGGVENKDSCNGDSGGPLMYVHSFNGEPRYFAIGIVSFGVKACGKLDKPAIYTRVAGYMDWILDNLQP